VGRKSTICVCERNDAFFNRGRDERSSWFAIVLNIQTPHDKKGSWRTAFVLVMLVMWYVLIRDPFPSAALSTIYHFHWQNSKKKNPFKSNYKAFDSACPSNLRLKFEIKKKEYAKSKAIALNSSFRAQKKRTCQKTVPSAHLTPRKVVFIWSSKTEVDWQFVYILKTSASSSKINSFIVNYPWISHI